MEERFIHRGVTPGAHSGPQVDLCEPLRYHQVQAALHPLGAEPHTQLLQPPPNPSTPDSTKSSKCSTDEAAT